MNRSRRAAGAGRRGRLAVLVPVGVLGAFALTGTAAAAPSPNCAKDGTTATVTCTFTSTTPGGPQLFTVPAGVTSITVTADGAQGGSADVSGGGLGGEATATFPVAPGDPVEVVVGGRGGPASRPVGQVAGAGGFNGGGAGGVGGTGGVGGSVPGRFGGGGGGASDVRTGTCAATLSCGPEMRVLVAGGGGGAVASSGSFAGQGGGGGNPSGADGTSASGFAGFGGGGSQTVGGAGGAGDFDTSGCTLGAGRGGQAGGTPTQDQGGAGGGGGSGNSVTAGGDGGGGGGGGYWGGGGGGGGCAVGGASGGGGGGSSWSSSDATNVTFTNATRSGNGQVTISYTASQSSPTLTTTAGPSSVNLNDSAVTLTDSADLEGGFLPTGTITFTLTYGGAVVDTETATVNGNGTYTTPAGYTLPADGSTVTGSYTWTASYSGDANDEVVTADSESVVVSPALTDLTTTAIPNVQLGPGAAPTLTDKADLEGGYHPGGTITFTLDAPHGNQVDTETVTVNGNGTYTTPTGYTLPTAGPVTGTYTWNATYNPLADLNNLPNGAPAEQTVSPAGPALTTTPDPATATPGTLLKDAADLEGGYYPVGAITFVLSDPNGNQVDAETVPANGNGTYTTPTGYTVPAGDTGTYTWNASYSGDDNNSSNTSGGFPEPVTVAKASPGITSTPGGTVVTGATMTDSATLTNGASPTGTITFTLYDPHGKAVDSETATVNGNGTYTTPAGFVPTAAGTYQWVAAYSGDGGNNAASTNMGDEPQTAQYGFGGFLSPLPRATLQRSGSTIPVKFRLTNTAGQPIAPATAAALAAGAAVKVTLTGPGISPQTAQCTWNTTNRWFQCNIRTLFGLKTGTASPYLITAFENVGAGFVQAPAVTTASTPNPETVFFR